MLNKLQYAAQGDILVIDDNLDNLRVLSEILKQRGHTARCVRDGTSALQAAVAQPPDLVLLDIRLPDINGYDVCRRLKAVPATHQIPVIFISALDQPLDRIRGFEVGGEDYINKPFQEREVVTRVESKLLHYQVLQQQRELTLHAERQRIARDLHDSLQQTLFILGVSAQSLAQEPLPESSQRELRRIHELSQTAIAELRVMLFELRPEKLVRTSLVGLFKHLVEANRNRTEAELNLIADITACKLPPDVHITFYRVAQEALHNAIVHADATHINVTLNHDSQRTVLRVVDDGCGFNAGALEDDESGNGLDNMRERAANLALDLFIVSDVGRGTEVSLIWKHS